MNSIFQRWRVAVVADQRAKFNHEKCCSIKTAKAIRRHGDRQLRLCLQAFESIPGWECTSNVRSCDFRTCTFRMWCGLKCDEMNRLRLLPAPKVLLSPGLHSIAYCNQCMIIRCLNSACTKSKSQRYQIVSKANTGKKLAGQTTPINYWH